MTKEFLTFDSLRRILTGMIISIIFYYLMNEFAWLDKVKRQKNYNQYQFSFLFFLLFRLNLNLTFLHFLFTLNWNWFDIDNLLYLLFYLKLLRCSFLLFGLDCRLGNRWLLFFCFLFIFGIDFLLDFDFYFFGLACRCFNIDSIYFLALMIFAFILITVPKDLYAFSVFKIVGEFSFIIGFVRVSPFSKSWS